MFQCERRLHIEPLEVACHSVHGEQILGTVTAVSAVDETLTADCALHVTIEAAVNYGTMALSVTVGDYSSLEGPSAR